MKKIIIIIILSLIINFGYGENYHGKLYPFIESDTPKMKIVGIIESKTMCLVTNIQKRYNLGDIHIRIHERRIMLPYEQLCECKLNDKKIIKLLYDKIGYVYVEDCFLLIQDIDNSITDSLIKKCLSKSYSLHSFYYEPCLSYLDNKSLVLNSKYSYQSFLTDRFLIVELAYEDCFNKLPNIEYGDSYNHDFWLKPTDQHPIRIAIPICCSY